MRAIRRRLGQLFCDGSALQIVEMLFDECAVGGVKITLGSALGEIDHADGRYRVRYGNGRVAIAKSLVIATRGPSIPKLGATGFAYDLGATVQPLKLVETRPALVPLTLGGDEALFRSLAEVAGRQ